MLQAINRQIAHYAYHAGQIVFLAKHFRSSEWKSLSIPAEEIGRVQNGGAEHRTRSGLPVERSRTVCDARIVRCFDALIGTHKVPRHAVHNLMSSACSGVKPEAAPGAEIREVKIPAFGRRDVLVKVKVASICGTDLHIYNWDRWAQNRIHPPLIPGHEFCGEVAAFGDEVTSVKEGDFVSAEMHVACGKCLQCRTGEAHICQNVKIIGVDADGAFAEYVVIPESNIWKLDPAIPLGLRVDSRSPRQRGAHGAGGGDCRQDRGDHRLRADRALCHRRGQGGGRDSGFCH